MDCGGGVDRRGCGGEGRGGRGGSGCFAVSLVSAGATRVAPTAPTLAAWLAGCWDGGVGEVVGVGVGPDAETEAWWPPVTLVWVVGVWEVVLVPDEALVGWWWRVERFRGWVGGGGGGSISPWGQARMSHAAWGWSTFSLALPRGWAEVGEVGSLPRCLVVGSGGSPGEGGGAPRTRRTRKRGGLNTGGYEPAADEPADPTAGSEDHGGEVYATLRAAGRSLQRYGLLELRNGLTRGQRNRESSSETFFGVVERARRGAFRCRAVGRETPIRVVVLRVY